MKKRKSYRIRSLVYLYFDFIFQKTTLIIFLISLILISLILYLIASSDIFSVNYLDRYKEIHVLYNRQAVLIIQIFNSIMITSIIIQLGIFSESFDVLFISYVPRKIICLSKGIALSIILLFIALFEMLVLNIVASIKFSMYIVSYKEILSSIHIFISLLFEGLFGIIFCALLGTIFAPMIIMFLFIVIKILCNNSITFFESISSMLPFIGYNRAATAIVSSPIYIGLMWVLLLGLLYNGIYSIKNLK